MHGKDDLLKFCGFQEICKGIVVFMQYEKMRDITIFYIGRIDAKRLPGF